MKCARVIILVFLLTNIFAQDKQDNIWLFGHGPNRPVDHFGGSMIDFSSEFPYVQYFNINTRLFDCSSICNNLGELCLYTNNCAIFNNNHLVIPNSDKLNLGQINIDYCQGVLEAYPTKSSTLILQPFSKDTFSIFHGGLTDNFDLGKLNLTTITAVNYDSYKISNKSNVIDTSFITDGIQAIKHGNGRDWWIVMHESSSNNFIKYLFTPAGIIGPIKQAIGNTWTHQYWTAQAAFSLDGNWYALVSEYNGVNLFRFDRCTGILSDYKSLNHPASDNRNYPRGVCFSPNSKLLYVSADFSLYQYNLDAPDISNSYTLIDTTDHYKLPYTFFSTFYQLMLAPDHKIYGITNSESNFLHVIHNPDLPGKACNLKQHDILLPSTYFQSMPNFPHFRIFDWDDSPCDTLGIDKSAVARWRYAQDSINYLRFDFTDLSYTDILEWTWNFGDPTSVKNSSALKNPEHIFTKNGIYPVCLIAKNKHGSDTLCKDIQIGPVGTEDNGIQIDIKSSVLLAPNPCKEFLEIQISNYNPQNMTAHIYNQMGLKLKSVKLYQGVNKIEMDDLIPGIYFISILENGRLQLTKNINRI
ncbi:MAG: PKD domain-containing protein [Saprospiraceae bacterium]|nr:PKD domain-containing protein [Saprospiraceae bacterium]